MENLMARASLSTPMVMSTREISSMVQLKALAYTPTRTAQDTKGTGRPTSSMATVSKYGLMDRSTRVIISTVSSKAAASLFSRTDHSTTVSFSRVIFMVKAA